MTSEEKLNRPVKILLVDDNRDFMEMTKTYIERISDTDATIKCLTDPEEAFRSVKHNKYDVVVSDYMMHEMNGIELLEQIIELDKTQPFIIETMSEKQKIEDKAYEMGATAFKRKNTDKLHYSGLVKKILDTAKKHRKLNELEKRNKALDKVSEILLLTSEDGKYLKYNRTILDILEIEKEDFENRKVWKEIFEDQNKIQELFDSDEIGKTVEIKPSDSRLTKQHSWRVTKIENASRNIISIQGAVKD